MINHPKCVISFAVRINPLPQHWVSIGSVHFAALSFLIGIGLRYANFKWMNLLKFPLSKSHQLPSISQFVKIGSISFSDLMDSDCWVNPFLLLSLDGSPPLFISGEAKRRVGQGRLFRSCVR